MYNKQNFENLYTKNTRKNIFQKNKTFYEIKVLIQYLLAANIYKFNETRLNCRSGPPTKNVAHSYYRVGLGNLQSYITTLKIIGSLKFIKFCYQIQPAKGKTAACKHVNLVH